MAINQTHADTFTKLNARRKNTRTLLISGVPQRMIQATDAPGVYRILTDTEQAVWLASHESSRKSWESVLARLSE